MHMFGGFGRGFGYGPMFGYNLFGGYGWIIFLLLFGFIFFLLFRAIRKSSQMTVMSHSNEAIEIAKRRYASGEIDLAKYQEIMKTIEK